jgi:hypothetical protein
MMGWIDQHRPLSGHERTHGQKLAREAKHKRHKADGRPEIAPHPYVFLSAKSGV